MTSLRIEIWTRRGVDLLVHQVAVNRRPVFSETWRSGVLDGLPFEAWLEAWKPTALSLADKALIAEAWHEGVERSATQDGRCCAALGKLGARLAA